MRQTLDLAGLWHGQLNSIRISIHIGVVRYFLYIIDL